jgi:hypothetical protein
MGLGSFSPAGTALGLGDMLRQQVGQETDEERERKRRLAQMQQRGFSPASNSILGTPSGSVAPGGGMNLGRYGL